MGKSGVRGRASMIFPILGISPNEGNQWKLGKDTILELIERKDLFKKNGKVYGVMKTILFSKARFFFS